MKSSVFKKENILKKIIMVSTNNTCRSFIAESILRQYLLDADQKNVEVISRGLVVLFPEPVHVKAADMVIKTCGIESLDFRSAQLTQEEVEESDLILTMTEEQKDKVLEEYHGYKEIATLNEYARVEGAIIDPYGMEDDDYERCFEQIARLVKKIWMLFRRILRLSSLCKSSSECSQRRRSKTGNLNLRNRNRNLYYSE